MARRKRDPYKCPRCGKKRRLTTPRVGPDKFVPHYWCVGGCWLKEKA